MFFTTKLPSVVRIAARSYATRASDIKTVGIVGCGTIGTSWALQYLQRGLNVVAWDPNPDVAPRMLDFFAVSNETFQASGAPGSYEVNLAQFKFTPEITGLADVDFIQESGPEQVEVKRELYSKLEEVIRPDTIISSSSSGILPSRFQAGAKHPERILLGHPFNPPHLIPLVEICGGPDTSAENIKLATEFYDALGKSAVVMNKEIEGHIANRFQAAILQEALSLLDQGVASVEDLDRALSDGPGLRWAVYGQFLNFHLGGGQGGIARMFNHLGPAFLKMMKDMEQIDEYKPKVVEEATKGVNHELEANNITNPDLIEGRDKVIYNIIAAKEKFVKLKPTH